MEKSIFEFAEKFEYQSPFGNWLPNEILDIAIAEEIDIYVTKVEGPISVCEGTYYQFKVTKFNTTNFNVQNLLSKINWGYSLDDGSITNIPDKGKVIPNKNEVLLNWKIPKLSRGQFLKMYAWIHKPSKNVCSSSFILRYPFFFDRYKLKGLNQQAANIADDMCYGDGVNKTSTFKYTKEEVEALGTLMKNITMKLSNDALWTDFKLMVTTLFSIGELEKVALEMIVNFKSNKGIEFTNNVLTKNVIKHESTITFIKTIENAIRQKINDNKGDLSTINDNTIYLTTSGVGRYGRPQFSSLTDTFLGGLTICINDTWAYEVIIENFDAKDSNNYNLSYKVNIYDHFGLDYPDLQVTSYYTLAGFRAWFVLQHIRNFKPFITKVEIKRAMSGSIKASKK
ncbi:MAG: DUF3289 family protein [Bacteroidetes bacterium]|nr:DUF3289 family protein [Bacteroidota bacterium]